MLGAYTPDGRPQDVRRVAVLSLHTSPLAQPGGGDAGGMNVYVSQLCRHLALFGVEVDVFTRVPENEPAHAVELAPGVTVHHLPAGPPEATKNDLAAFVPQLTRAIARHYHDAAAPDAVHSHYWVSGLAGLALRAEWSVPLVHTMHTLARVKLREDPQAAEPPARLDAEDRLAAEADVLTANTPTECQELRDLYGASPDKIAVVPPGVERTIFRADGPDRWLEADDGRAAPGRPLRILFAGRIQRLKGPHILLEALQRVREIDPLGRYEAVLIGQHSGPDELDLERLLPSTSGPVTARLLEPMPPAELASWFRGADVVAVPSYSESFGLVAAEAQACGTPVLANLVGGLRHIVHDGVTGRHVVGQTPEAWAEALATLGDHRDALAQWGRQAAVHADRFDWNQAARTVLSLYRSHAVADLALLGFTPCHH
ncbi:glycosyltransferase [Zhihengliuella halotolerans]|uniref:D-inositol 3-phosphate glycosyltransferase n=1 Tax=Zhihengliuella halotolerans TaxID=370736 RepID=A0A4Q8AC40_9MICC|nr:glycosyltransferase [Zhihengliuella halotolerans]RZU61271.1 D-inositol-3-phosphate glycosyltransferase [Zhihengliuella halotolerans]